MIELRLTWFIAIGIGAGANVLLRFASDHPDKMAGLILANPSAGEAGERICNEITESEGVSLKGFGVSGWTKSESNQRVV